MTQDELLSIAWRDFIVWAWSEAEMRDAFTAATGVEIRQVTSPIDAAVDDATGANRSLASQFIEWATVTQWGIEHAPAAYRATLEARAAK